MTDDPVPELTTSQNGGQVPVASLDAITVLVHSFGSMITSMEARITARINENAAASKERWGRWEQEFKDYRTANDLRIAKVEGRVDRLEDEEEHDQLVWDARLGPLRNAITLLSRNWKTVLVIAFAILGFFGLANVVIEDGLHMLGLP